MATVELTKENFNETVEGNEIVLADFWAEWCGPCKAFGPVYEKVSGKHDDIVFAKCNTEEQQELAAHFEIRSIPTLMVFREQVMVFNQPGALPESMLEDLISKVKELDMAAIHKEITDHEAGIHDHGCGGNCSH